LPDISQYAVKPKEIAELIAKSAGLTEGEWWLSMTFGFAPGNFGPSDAEIAPGVAVIVQNLTLQRVLPGVQPRPPEALIIDVSTLNQKVKT
jgi:hypothetical protein